MSLISGLVVDEATYVLLGVFFFQPSFLWNYARHVHTNSRNVDEDDALWRRYFGPDVQGRRHGFESGGGTILRKKISFLTPHFLVSGGTKYCLDS